MKISVAICTWNRANMLRDTLNTLGHALSNVKSEVEVIVVNNNSTDDTNHVLQEASRTLPLRCVFEPNPGVSNARNTAVRMAAGKFIVWTDDDVSVHPNWLYAYERAFERYPNCSFFGGPILPKFEDVPPVWLPAILDQIPHVFSVLDFSSQPFQIMHSSQLPFGANFAVRTKIQRQFHYDPTLGRQPSHCFLASEETVVMESMLKAGHVGWWIPAARVEHRIPKRRMTIQYIIKHGFGHGCTITRINPKRMKLRKFLNVIRKAVVARITEAPEIWIIAIYRASAYAGKIFESAKKH